MCFTHSKEMSHLHNTTYPHGHCFSHEDLSNLTTSDLMRWMNKKVYDVEDPSLDERPKARAGTIGFWKKPISFSYRTD